ncbi:hypothetical protein L2E82_34415 [Cichorium intybus]|uniref:Uncharacterized protein n=1 Tax=Cichorium intybus TaxID=13427 RepID=A0ACB9BM39_CICIN|nr:hypothetical protein L2E82_34415 [Cichorium intybus]
MNLQTPSGAASECNPQTRHSDAQFRPVYPPSPMPNSMNYRSTAQPSSPIPNSRNSKLTYLILQSLDNCRAFNECPHPNEKTRLLELGLTPQQLKFWFQN